MVVASGFVEAEREDNVDAIVKELGRRLMDVGNIASGKVAFLFRRETVDEVRGELESLRGNENIRSVHLTYYSIE